MPEIAPATAPLPPTAAAARDLARRRPKKVRQGKHLVDPVPVARLQRYAIVTVLVGIVIYFSFFALAIAGTAGRGQGTVMIGVMFVNVLLFLSGIATIVVAAMLAYRLKYNVLSIVFICLLMLIPLVGLLLLLSINGRATTILRVTGAQVGLIGVSKAEMPKLYEGTCAHCGYDLLQLGSADRCPECGTSVSESLTRT
ncbi:MAG: zinc ribbon domain-containing protein [Phycisphaeraceae bacterium]|nr:zinc ribbon domain-containing protein [Phycisphaeraceae bacterium]